MRKLIVFLFFLICNEFYSQTTVDLDIIIGKSQNNLVGDSIRLEVNTYKAFKKMEAAAKRDGIYLKIVSAYRGFERQKLIWNNKYEKFTNDFSLEPKKAISEIIRFSTVPGTSRHHWGTDIDIIDGNFPDEENVLVSEKFEKDGLFYKVKNWLDNNSENFGFYLTYTNDKNRKGFEFEPWHYSYKPVSVKYYRALIKTDLKKIIKSLDIIRKDSEMLSLFSVNKSIKNPYFNMVERNISDEYFSLVKKDKGNYNSRQSAPEVFSMNAAFYWYKRDFFDQNHISPVTERTGIFEIKHICFDIDTPLDFTFIEFLIKNNELDFKL